MRTLMLCLLLMLLTSCTQTATNLPEEQIEALAAMVYPADMPRGDDLDIVVVRQGRNIQIVSRTPNSYDNVTLWLNQQYVRPLQHLDIGTDNIVDLTQAINQHGQAYPVGSFLEPDKSMLLVQAELIDPKTNLRYRLTVEPPLK